jgi:N-acetyl-1-D-myo-inositol-2-amino-2-deoxy-alpha-D-glucopyranoside deacetylase
VVRGRLLLVHAHPDDETINTGATMAYHAAQDVEVTLLTCTLGEEGEILPPDLAQLRSGAADQLGGYRIGELAAAMQALGVTDHRFLGGPGRFRDSGMLGSPANGHPRAFWRADADRDLFAAAVSLAAAVIADVRPHVIVTYDPVGGYGHPDHVMAHRVTTAAIAAAADSWRVAKLYWTAFPASAFVAGNAAARAAGLPFTAADDAQRRGVVDDDRVTTVVDADSYRGAKRVALLAHRTQLAVHGDFFALTNLVARPISGTEHFRLAAGLPGALGDDDLEHDLFAGVEL